MEKVNWLIERDVFDADEQWTYQVDKKTNEIKALPELIESLALKGVVLAFDAINTQKKLFLSLFRMK